MRRWNPYTLGGALAFGLALLAGCDESQKRTEITPEPPNWSRTEEPLWYNQPVLTAPAGSPQVQAQKQEIERQKRLKAEKKKQAQGTAPASPATKP